MAAPGWYKDRGDPALARWFDGEIWTEDTVLIAEQQPGVRPDPPAGWTFGPAGFERIPEPAPVPEPAPEPAAWAPPSRPPAAHSLDIDLDPDGRAHDDDDGGLRTQPVPAIERPAPGPASHLEELPPQGPSRVFRDLPDGSGPTGFRAPHFEPPDFEGPPANRFAAMPLSLRVGLLLALLVVVGVAAIALL
jgi:hypothetical protein